MPFAPRAIRLRAIKRLHAAGLIERGYSDYRGGDGPFIWVDPDEELPSYIRLRWLRLTDTARQMLADELVAILGG